MSDETNSVLLDEKRRMSSHQEIKASSLSLSDSQTRLSIWFSRLEYSRRQPDAPH